MLSPTFDTHMKSVKGHLGATIWIAVLRESVLNVDVQWTCVYLCILPLSYK